VSIQEKPVNFILIQNCSYCLTNTKMLIELYLPGRSEYFCSTECIKKYRKQFDERLKI
jgi:hypothetical protein